MLGSRTRTAAALLAAGLLLTGCGQSAQGSSGQEDRPDLLSAAKVGGTRVDDAARLVASAGPDGTELLGGARGSNTVGYRRSAGGGQELVLIGAWDRTDSSYRDGMSALRACLEKQQCSTRPTGFTGRVVSGLPSGSYGFTTERTNQDDRRVGVARSYTRVGDRLVLVSIQREGGTVPTQSELERLTRDQVALTRSGGSD